MSQAYANLRITKKGKLMKHTPISKSAEAVAIEKIEAVLGRKLAVAELAMVQITIHHYHYNQQCQWCLLQSNYRKEN